jgi:hypothetical protein
MASWVEKKSKAHCTLTMIPTVLPLVLAIAHPDTARSLSEGASATGEQVCTTRALRGSQVDGVFYATDAVFGTLNTSECYVMGDKASCIHRLPDSHRPANVTACSMRAGEETVMSWLVGSMTSTGGLDWWSIMLTDTADRRSLGQLIGYALTLHEGNVPPKGAPPGAMLSLPPLHIHHSTGLAFGMEWVEAGDNMLRAEGFASQYHNFSSRGLYSKATDDSMIEWGRACLGSQRGAPRTSACLRLRSARSDRVLAVFNDVRPAGSPPLTWYLNITLRLLPNATVAARALRPSKVIRLRSLSNRASWFATMAVPPDLETVAIMEGVWNFSGHLLNDPVLSHFHAHMEMLQSAYLFRGSAQELGLDMAALGSDSGCSPVSPARGGFASNDAMLRALKSRCPRCFQHGRPSGTRRLLCVANGSAAKVGQYAYDRRATLDCGASLRVRVTNGERFTSVTFLGRRPEAPFFPGTRIRNMAGVDGYFPQHTIWDFSADTDDGHDGPDLRTYLPLLQAPNARIDNTTCGVGKLTIEQYALPLGDGR